MKYFDKVPTKPPNRTKYPKVKMAVTYTKARNKEIKIQAETYARPISVP